MRAEEGERDRGADGERATRKMAKVGGAEERREAGGRAGRPRPKSERQNILTHETAIHLCGETKSAPVKRACSLGRITESRFLTQF